MHTAKSTSLDLICQLDGDFYKANPGKSEYRRKVFSAELPRALRGLRIRDVQVVQLAEGIFLRGLLNEHGRVVAQSVYFDYRLFSSAEGKRQVKSVLRTIGKTFPLAAAGKGGKS